MPVAYFRQFSHEGRFVDPRRTCCLLKLRRKARGRQGRPFRRLVAGIPTARLRDRLVQMIANRGLAVIAVDPAYTSTWGAEHWLGALHNISPDATGHHAAALVIGRRGLAQRARRRERCDWTRPEDRRHRELPTPPRGPCRQPPACAGRDPGNPEPAPPQGSHSNGGRPERPAGLLQATRWPKT